MGLLPIEVAEQARRRPFGRADLRVAMALGDPYLGQVPLVAAQFINGGWEDGEADGDPMIIDDIGPPGGAVGPATAAVAAVVDGGGPAGMLRSLSSKGAPPLVNGEAKAAVAVAAVAVNDPARQPEDENWAWQGALAADTMALDATLDDLLAD